MLRILMLNFEYPPIGGGSSPVTRSLARALTARGHEVDVVTMGFRGLPAEEEDGGVRVYRVRCLRARTELSRVHELAIYLAAGLRKTAVLVRRRRYDLCHSHFFLPTAAIAYLLRTRTRSFPPYVVTTHGSDLPGYNPDRFVLFHRFTPFLIRPIALHARAVIVPSVTMERLVRARFGDCTPDLVRIPNGIDPDGFRVRRKERRILVAARLFERKGVQHVIDALAAADPDGYQVDVAGDGPERGALESQARRRRVRATFHGWLARDRLQPLFERSRIFVLASTSENFPVSLLEAMAARCAIVTTRAGGCPEVVGDAALLVEPGNVAELRDAISTLLRDEQLARNLGEKAWQRVQSFAWPEIAARHEQVYLRAMAG